MPETLTLEDKLKRLPRKPGVYLFKDAEGQIVYIGKAKILRNRVRSYFQSSDRKDFKTRRMIPKIKDLDWIVMPNEIEALISEQDYDKENLRLDNNGNVFAAFVASKPDRWWKILPSEVHLGPAYWIHTSRFIGANMGFTLALKWHIGEHATVNIRHWSNAGTTKPNRGQDLLTFGWRF